MVLYGTLLKIFYLAIKRVLVLHCYKPKNPFLVLFRTIFLKNALVTTKVCRIPSLNAQHIEPWSRWATAAEDHTGCRSCQRHSDGRVRIWHKERESMDPSCLVSMVKAGGGCVMVWRIFSLYTLGPLFPIEYCLNATSYLSIVADHVHPFMATMYTSSDGYFSTIMHHVTKLKSSQTGFLNMTMSSLYSNGLHNNQISIQ